MDCREGIWKGAIKCKNCGIRDKVLFAGLDDRDLDSIRLPIHVFLHENRTPLYCTSEPAKHVITIRSGLIKLVRYLPDGTPRIVRLLRQGAVAGLESLFGGPYEHTATPLKPTTVCRIPASVVNDLNIKSPRLQSSLMGRWQSAVRAADDWLVRYSVGSSRTRMARMILSLPDGPGGARELFNREDLAAMLAITKETASRTVAEFKREGLIVESGRNNYKCDVRALRELAEE